jgi:hypothetical protein
LSNIELLPAFATEVPAFALVAVDAWQRPDRAQAFQAVFAWLRTADREGSGIRWTFENAPGVERGVRELARTEHAYCPFLSFAISTRGDEVVWETRASAGAEALISAFYALPETVAQDERAFAALVPRALSRAH